MEVYLKIADALQKNESAVLVSVIASSGSVPRGSGAHLAVFENGTASGTVGGGMIEYKGIERARAMLNGHRPAYEESFHMDNDEAAKHGMVCGGQATLYYQKLEGKAAARFFETVAAVQKEDADHWLAFRAEEQKEPAMLCYTKEAAVAGLGDFSSRTEPFVATDTAQTVREKNDTVFVEPLGQKGRVLIFGGGHVAQALAPVLLATGFRVAVYEDRDDYLSHRLFPSETELLHGAMDAVGDTVAIRPSDYVVITTRGHLGDLDILRHAVTKPCRYLGMIGSRRKVKTLFDQLREEGVTDAVLDRVYSPIGLSIGAVTPAEIAVSIAAEMIRVRATGQ